MENNYSGIPPMPEEFYNHNRGKCPHFTPKRSNFFSDEHKIAYENWDEFGDEVVEPDLLIQFQAWNQAWKAWSKAHDDWNYMDLARCHGKWIALVKAWENFYTQDNVSELLRFIRPVDDPA